jgi:hypothetical protein
VVTTKQSHTLLGLLRFARNDNKKVAMTPFSVTLTVNEVKGSQ